MKTSKKSKRVVNLLQPHPFQYDIYKDPARFKVVAAGRRIGKTELGKMLAGQLLLQGKEIFWISPTFAMSQKVWIDLKQTFFNLITWKSEQGMTMHVQNGGSLRVFSGENYDRIRGNSPHFVVVDEAAYMQDPDMWHGVIRPSLADHEGGALFISTPKGSNSWFYDLYQLGMQQDFGYKSWRMPTWYNPYIKRSEIIETKRTMPDKLFRQEIAAEFMLDAGEVFVGVAKAAKVLMREPYEGRFSMGIDLGRKHDYTVVTVFDMDTNEMVYMNRFNKITWPAIQKRIVDDYTAWKPTICQIEENSAGDVVISQLRNDGVNAVPFRTSNQSKRSIIEAMSVAIQNKEVDLLVDQQLILEFQAMQLKRTSTGLITYSAPPGMHDDIVMSACIAWNGIRGKNIVFGSAIPLLG